MIISYEMFVRGYELIRKVPFDLVVCDEGHRLKNTAIKTTSVSAWYTETFISMGRIIFRKEDRAEYLRGHGDGLLVQSVRGLRSIIFGGILPKRYYLLYLKLLSFTR